MVDGMTTPGSSQSPADTAEMSRRPRVGDVWKGADGLVDVLCTSVVAGGYNDLVMYCAHSNTDANFPILSMPTEKFMSDHGLTTGKAMRKLVLTRVEQ